jgi:hypothetical protein
MQLLKETKPKTKIAQPKLRNGGISADRESALEAA